MRIAFDVFGMVISLGRGIGYYSADLILGMMSRHPDDEYFIFNLADEDFHFPGGYPPGVKVTEFHKYFGKNGRLMSVKNADEAVGDVIRKFIRDNQIDVFYLTSLIVGIPLPHKKEWFEGCRTVAVAYDLIPLLFPEQYMPKQSQVDLYMKKLDSLRWIDEIHAISQSVKDDLVTHAGFDPAKIKVIYSGVDARFSEKKPAEADERRLRERYGIPGKFMICTGGGDFRKNIQRLIAAYSRLPKDILAEYQLVIVCKLAECQFKQLNGLAKENGVDGRVVLTGFVSDEDLPRLYNMSSLLVFPSLYEGFGLPVVEAWACGKPVLTSNNSSLGEIAADAAITVDPSSEESIADGLRHALTDCDLADYARRGRERLSLFQWSRVADLAYEGVRSVFRAGRPAPAAGRKRLAFFSPLPPVKSGISDYSVELLGELVKYYDIDIFIDDGYDPSIAFGAGIRVFRHWEFHGRREQYADIVYQVGNNAFHAYMFDYIKKFHGVVVLHDFNLHAELFRSAVQEARDLGLYRYCLGLDYPDDVAARQTDAIAHGKSLPWECELEVNGFIVNYADKVIVHSFDAKEKLLSRNLGHDVRQIWLPATFNREASPEQRARTRSKLGFGDSDFVFGVFGFQGRTKRTMQSLKAFSLLLSQRFRGKLLFVGEIAGYISKEFDDCIAKNAMAPYVKVTGFVPISDFNEYIGAVDASLNLRKFSNGETSATLYRNLAAGNVTIVNNSGSFMQIPSDACLKLPAAESMTEEQEIRAISEAMLKCLKDPAWLEATGKRARAFAESTLSIEKTARDYRDFIEKPACRGFTTGVVKAMVTRLQNGDEKEQKDGPAKLCETIIWAKG